MKDLKTFGWVSLTSIALFALAACGQAVAGSEQPQPAVAQVQVSVADSQPTSDADADNGPGCAESALDSSARTIAQR